MYFSKLLFKTVRLPFLLLFSVEIAHTRAAEKTSIRVHKVASWGQILWAKRAH